MKSQKKFQLIEQPSEKEVPEVDIANYINNFVNIGPNLARELTSPCYYEGIVVENNLNEIMGSNTFFPSPPTISNLTAI